MIDKATTRRLDHRIDDINSDHGELKIKVGVHETVLNKKNGKLGLVAEVAINTSFREQIATDIRKIFFLFLGQAIIVFIAVIFWTISQMN